jgi:quercetin dioxygenase-like cupin family protein
MKPWPKERSDALQQRLTERVRRSVDAHREFVTVRREDLPWQTVADGCEEAVLTSTAYTRVVQVRLAAGAALHWPDDARAQEVLVVKGNVQALPAGAEAPTVLAPHGFALRDDAAAGTLRAQDGPALVYVRHLLADVPTLPEPERTWWQKPRAALHLVPAGTRKWRPNFPGVDVLPLWGSADITSMLVRFAPGASVPDHRHAVHEDCLMLEGEMFLGDILLRAGDYQLAPAGGGHFGEMSDVGGTFFFHGAIDPVLIHVKP